MNFPSRNRRQSTEKGNNSKRHSHSGLLSFAGVCNGRTVNHDFSSGRVKVLLVLLPVSLHFASEKTHRSLEEERH
eukprot:s523_g39.t1